jgi:hypothetical protein
MALLHGTRIKVDSVPGTGTYEDEGYPVRKTTSPGIKRENRNTDRNIGKGKICEKTTKTDTLPR